MPVSFKSLGEAIDCLAIARTPTICMGFTYKSVGQLTTLTQQNRLRSEKPSESKVS